MFDKELDIEAWRWRFLENPAGDSVIRLCFNNSELISQYALSPVKFYVSGQETKSMMSLDTMTDPEFRGKGLFTRLANEAYINSIALGYKFVYGFPNENSYVPFIHRLAWICPGNMMEWSTDQSRTWYMTHAKNLPEVHEFDERFNLLSNRMSKKHKVISKRTSDFLNWRYLKNPRFDYKCFFVEEDTEILGYSILKKYQSSDSLMGNIVDLVALNDRTLIRLLAHARDFFMTENILDVKCWYPHSEEIERTMWVNGFHLQKMPRTYFGYRSLTNSPIAQLKDDKNWYLTMGDSDVF